MKSTLLKKEYEFVWEKDSMRKATILFKLTDTGWQFWRCDFFGIEGVYDLYDWEFLGDLAAEIKELCEKEAKG